MLIYDVMLRYGVTIVLVGNFWGYVFKFSQKSELKIYDEPNYSASFHTLLWLTKILVNSIVNISNIFI